MREDIENRPHHEQCDRGVGSFEDVLGVVVSFVVVVRLLDLRQQLVSVLQTELFSSQLLPRVKLRHGCVNYPRVLNVQHLVINVGPEISA